jgi:hypothetical protein
MPAFNFITISATLSFAQNQMSVVGTWKLVSERPSWVTALCL